MSDLAKNIGMRIRSLREDQGMSQQEFALMIGINRAYIGDVELGKRNIAIKNLEKIAKGLGVTVGELLEGL
jgi:transcriptional regulator with XRE-family HTH domain